MSYRYVAILCCISFFFGMLLGYGLAELEFKAQAIQHACAQYDPKTGEFMWVTPTDQ